MDGAAEPISVVAVTANPSLVIGLTFLGRDWEVASQQTLLGLPTCDVLVVDVGSTTDALTALGETDRPRPPAVLIGDEAAEVPDGDRLVLRPFTLEELAEHVEALARPELVTFDAPTPRVAPVAGPWTADARPWDQSEAATGVAGAASSLGATSMLRGWASRLRRAEAAHTASAEPPTDPAEESASTSEIEAAAASAGTDRDVVAGAEAGGEVVTAADALFAGHDMAVEAGAEPAPMKLPPPPPELIDLTAVEPPYAYELPAPPVADGSTIMDRPDIVIAPPPAFPTPQVGRHNKADAGEAKVTRSRFSARRLKHETGPEAELRRRLAEVVTVGDGLEDLVRQVPLLGSIRGLARAIVAEVTTEFAADSVGFWEQTPEGFRALATSGMTQTEARLLVPLEQPMLAEVHATGGGLLIDPIEAAQAAVAGIGGAHTESFMAASIAAGPGRYGILAVGRDDPLEPRDLDLLVDLAVEAAPGVAFAMLLRRLGAIIVPEEPLEAPVRMDSLLHA